MGLLKLFRSSKSNVGSEQADRSNSFSRSGDSHDASLTPPPRIGKESRSVSSTSIRSSSGFLGKKEGRAQSQLAIKTIPYESTPSQAPPPPRSASGSRFSSPRTPVAYNDQAEQNLRLSHIDPHRLADGSSPTTPRQAGPQRANNLRPLSKYVLPDLDLESSQSRSDGLVQFPSNDGRQLSSPREQYPDERTRTNSGMSWSNQGEEVLANHSEGPHERMHSSPNASRKGGPPVQQYRSSMETSSRRPLP